jgi:hypothetical protein
MKDIPIDEMTRERLLMEYKHFRNATELISNQFIVWLETLNKDNDYGSIPLIIKKAKEMLCPSN